MPTGVARLLALVPAGGGGGGPADFPAGAIAVVGARRPGARPRALRLAGAEGGLRHRRRVRRGVDAEDVIVRQEEADGVVPVARQPVLPMAAGRVELDDQPGL